VADPADPSPLKPRLRRPQAEPDPGFVAVGRILGPHGLGGEVKVQSLTDNPDRLVPGAQVFAADEQLTIASARSAGQHLYLTFRDHSDRDSVEPLRHRILQVHESDLSRPGGGEYYRFELIGLQAFDRSGTPLGRVAEIIETGSNDVLRIETSDGPDLLVPLLTDTLISVDLEARRITLDPPEWR
jgi:16S rRNA processing protein RimM